MKHEHGTIYIGVCLYCKGGAVCSSEPFTNDPYFHVCVMCRAPLANITLVVPVSILNDYAKVRGTI